MGNTNVLLDIKAQEIIKDVYNLGGSGGSEIVDALPAQGVEGTTYLLRTIKGDLFGGNLYVDLLNNQYYIVSEKYAEDLFYNEVDAKLNFSQDESGAVITNQLDVGQWYTPKNWQSLLDGEKCVIVSTEQDVLNLTEEYDYIFQDLGIVHLQDYRLVESRIQDSESGVAILNIIQKDCLSGKTTITATNIQFEARTLISDLEAEHPYSFGDWTIEHTTNKVGELTDTFIYDIEELDSLQVGDSYLINLTPTQPSGYDYQEYVFDKGVYTSVTAKTYLLQIRYGTTSQNGRIFFNCQVTSPNIKNYTDLYNYLLDNHYQAYISSGELGGAVLPVIGIIDNFNDMPRGIYAADYGENINILTNQTYYGLNNDEEIQISYVN